MPTFDGYRTVDLCAPEFMQQNGVVMPPTPTSMQSVPEASIQTVIR
jgi:hypothetical protein